MMKMKQLLITILLLLGTLHVSAQLRPVAAQSDSVIGIDLSVPDFDTKKIDAKIMGSRLAGILNYLLENYNQGVYSRQLAYLLEEQVEALEKHYFNIKKVKFQNAKKVGNDITIILKVWPDTNSANVKQADLMIHLIDGASNNQKTNELLSNMSHYVQMREQLGR